MVRHDSFYRLVFSLELVYLHLCPVHPDELLSLRNSRVGQFLYGGSTHAQFQQQGTLFRLHLHSRNPAFPVAMRPLLRFKTMDKMSDEKHHPQPSDN